MATSHWPTSPWQQASALLSPFSFFYWPISSLSNVSVPARPPPPLLHHSFQLLPFLKSTLFIDVCSYTDSSPPDETYQPADTIFVADEAVHYSGELVAVVWLVMHLQRPLWQAKCPWVACWSHRSFKLWSVLVNTNTPITASWALLFKSYVFVLVEKINIFFSAESQLSGSFPS